MTFAATVPCEWCGKKLRLEVDTDGMGGTVECVESCQCEDARWRRGECVDCGRAVPNGDTWPHAKRCPRDLKKWTVERHRRNERRRYRRHHERVLARKRDCQRRLREKRPAWHEERKRQMREAYRLKQRILRQPLRRIPMELRGIRNRLAYRLRKDEGMTYGEVAHLLNLSAGYAYVVVRRERKRRECPQQQEAA